MRPKPAGAERDGRAAAPGLRFGTLLICSMLVACAGDQNAGGGGEDSVEARKLAAARHAELDPRLRPDWTSRHHFPPEYCWYVATMDQAHPLYWDIRRFCDTKRGRGRSR